MVSMTVEEQRAREKIWRDICSQVTDRMLQHVRPFVVPLSHETENEVRLIGTGTFVLGTKGTAIATCEHVAREAPLNFRPNGQETVYGYTGGWSMHPEPVDAAWTIASLASPAFPVKAVQPHQVALQHNLSQPEELLFFYGYSGENSAFVFENHITNGSGYLTQQNRDAQPNLCDVELLWPNGEEAWSEGTTEEARRNMRFSDPAGFSGALVWNTRFLETGADLDRWTPDQAVVTAILKRFVPEDRVLLATPIEAVRSVGLSL